MSLPSTHLFQMRNIIHHYNEKKNNKLMERLKKTFGGMMMKNVYGQAVFGKLPSFLKIYINLLTFVDRH